MEKVTQVSLIIEFFKSNPNRDISHPEVVDWASAKYEKMTGDKFRDPDRSIRKLAQQGFLIKSGKGIYKYDPDYVENKELEEFTQAQKRAIFERDGHRCVVCGNGVREGLEIHADHIKAKDLGGKATIENGQTLCARHNFIKKNYKQTEIGKKMFIRMYELAKIQDDLTLQKFCKEILNVFEKNKMDEHIKWKK